MSIRKVVLVPFDQFKNLISQSVDESSDIIQENKVLSDSPSGKEISDKKRIIDKHLSGSKEIINKKKILKRNLLESEGDKPEKKQKIEISNLEKHSTLNKKENPVKQSLKRKLDKPPPPGLPNQLGAGIKKEDLYNFNSPVQNKTEKVKKNNLNDLIAKYWTE